MKKLCFAAAAALCLAACNSEPGPERTTPAEFGEVTFPAAAVKADAEVRVSAAVSSSYGLSRIYIAYMLDDDDSDVRLVSSARYNTREPASVEYTGHIPRQEAGRKVSFCVCAVTYYNVFSRSERMDYVVPGAEEGGGGEVIE